MIGVEVTANSQQRARARQVPRARARKQRMLRSTMITVAMLAVALFWFSPIILMLTTAFRTTADYIDRGPLSWPTQLTLDNFNRAWGVGNFVNTYRNSIIVTAVKVPLGLLVSGLLAFSLAKLRLPFRRTIIFTVFLGLTIPVFLTIVPIFVLTRQVGLIDNIFGLVGPYLAFGLPFEVLVLHSFFRRVPDEIIEAARIDGASNVRIFFQIVVPLSLPALVTVAVLDAVGTWNEFILALTILDSEVNKTIPLGLLNFQGTFSTDTTGLTAGILIAIVPMLTAYAFLQRFIITGLTASAIKG